MPNFNHSEQTHPQLCVQTAPPCAVLRKNHRGSRTHRVVKYLPKWLQAEVTCHSRGCVPLWRPTVELRVWRQDIHFRSMTHHDLYHLPQRGDALSDTHYMSTLHVSPHNVAVFQSSQYLTDVTVSPVSSRFTFFSIQPSGAYGWAVGGYLGMSLAAVPCICHTEQFEDASWMGWQSGTDTHSFGGWDAAWGNSLKNTRPFMTFLSFGMSFQKRWTVTLPSGSGYILAALVHCRPWNTWFRPQSGSFRSRVVRSTCSYSQ